MLSAPLVEVDPDPVDPDDLDDPDDPEEAEVGEDAPAELL